MGLEHYLAIDVGATKTLFAVFDTNGGLICECKIATHQDYPGFKSDIAQKIRELERQFRFSYCCCAVPAVIDFDGGVAVAFGNETWQNVPIRTDLEALLPDAKIWIHNDAKLAALSEAHLLQKEYKKLLYITLSTGIGGGVIIDGVIAKDFENFEPGQMVFEYEDKQQKWETFASGRALKDRYGKMAAEIDDPAVWQTYAKDLAIGFEDLLATVQPDAVIVGGGVGAHFEKFQAYLETELRKINNPMVPTPPLFKAQRPEEAVVYGCYEYIKQNV